MGQPGPLAFLQLARAVARLPRPHPALLAAFLEAARASGLSIGQLARRYRRPRITVRRWLRGENLPRHGRSLAAIRVHALDVLSRPGVPLALASHAVPEGLEAGRRARYVRWLSGAVALLEGQAARPADPEDVLTLAASFADCAREVLRGKSRRAALVDARAAVAFVLEARGFPLAAIAALLLRDPSTVSASLFGKGRRAAGA